MHPFHPSGTCIIVYIFIVYIFIVYIFIVYIFIVYIFIVYIFIVIFPSFSNNNRNAILKSSQLRVEQCGD